MEPKLEDRSEQPALVIRAGVRRETLPHTLGSLFGELSAWLESHGVTPEGPPFVRYVFVDDEFDTPTHLEAGFPVAAGVSGDDRVVPVMLPAGRYATVLHSGPYCDLHTTTAELLAWAEKNGMKWDRSADGKTWASRLEIYLNDPECEPDPEKRRTELAFLLVEG
jgi:effector-binding domain-containing protein